MLETIIKYEIMNTLFLKIMTIKLKLNPTTFIQMRFNLVNVHGASKSGFTASSTLSREIKLENLVNLSSSPSLVNLVNVVFVSQAS